MLGALGSQGFRLLTSAREPPKDSSQPADDGVAPPDLYVSRVALRISPNSTTDRCSKKQVV